MAAVGAASPPGPDVGDIVDGTLPGPEGPLSYRLYRPASPGPHPVLCYFHGGGWLFGDQASDEPLCRDLCVRTDAVVVSVGYRHAPEHPFPAPVDDAVAALEWVADHIEELGGIPGALTVGGWSAGANLATVAAQRARDVGGPVIVGQLLICPVTDGSTEHPSYVENGTSFLLTADVMRWFWDNYADPAARRDAACVPTARQLGRPAAGVHRDRRVRPAAGRGRGLCRGAPGGWGRGAPRRWAGPDPHLDPHGGRRDLRGRRARRDGSVAAQDLRHHSHRRGSLIGGRDRPGRDPAQTVETPKAAAMLSRPRSSAVAPASSRTA